MNFDEPSIDELIQNDLNCEMNKILQQSNETTVAAQQQQDNNEDNSSDHFLFDELSNSNILKKDCEFTSNTSNDGSPQSHHSDSPEHRTGTTSMEAEFIAFDAGNLQLTKETSSSSSSAATSNDLSNLAWLSSVDVQQSIPKESKQQQQQSTGNIIYQQQAETQIGGGQIANNNPPAPSMIVQQQQQQQQANEQATQQCEATSSNFPHNRYAPIQPNIFGFGPNQQQQQQQSTGNSGIYFTNQPSTSTMSYEQAAGTQQQQQQLMPHIHNSNNQQQQRRHCASYRPYPAYDVRGYERHHHHHHVGRPTPPQPQAPHKVFPKPVYSYSCLIAMSLQKSKTGALPVSDIYSFMMEKFPYFKTAPDGWKNSVRHNLSLNKCFEKVEKPNGSQRKGCLWALNPAKATKMEEELQKWKRKDPESIRKSMSNPEEFDREMEELRRSDEEAARRRLMGLANRGLPMMTSCGGGYNFPHPPPPPHQHHISPHHYQQSSGPPPHNSGPPHYHQQLHHQISHHQHHPASYQQQQNFTFNLQPPGQQQQFNQQQQQQAFFSGQQQQIQLDGQQETYTSEMMVQQTGNQQSNNQQTSNQQTSFLDTLQADPSSHGNELSDLESSLGDLTAFQTDEFFSWNDSIHTHHQQQQQPAVVAGGDQLLPPAAAYNQPSSIVTSQSAQPAAAAASHQISLPSLTLPPVDGGSEVVVKSMGCDHDCEEFDSVTTNHNSAFSGAGSYMATNSKTVMLH